MALPGILDPEDDFGLPKENYSHVRDPRKDLDFNEYERMAVAVSMLSYTAPRCWAIISGAAAAGAMVRDHRAVWGETSAVVPTCTATATGTYKITFPASVTDLNPTASSVTTSAVQFSTMQVCMHEVGISHATCAANVITVFTKTHAGTAAAKNFTVFGYY
jgi:hypothetical protein